MLQSLGVTNFLVKVDQSTSFPRNWKRALGDGGRHDVMEVLRNDLSSCSEHNGRKTIRTKHFAAVNTSQYVAHSSIRWTPQLCHINVNFRKWCDKRTQGTRRRNKCSPGVLSNRALCLCPFCLSFSELNSSIQMGCSTKCALLMRCSVAA